MNSRQRKLVRRAVEQNASRTEESYDPNPYLLESGALMFPLVRQLSENEEADGWMTLFINSATLAVYQDAKGEQEIVDAVIEPITGEVNPQLAVQIQNGKLTGKYLVPVGAQLVFQSPTRKKRK